jgi:pyridoxamine 5'-phosphate oxidase
VAAPACVTVASTIGPDVHVVIRVSRRLAFATRFPPVPDFALPLREEDVNPDPLRQFAAWYKEAAAAGFREPGAMAVATSTVEGTPSVRMVLLKEYDDRGFLFYTNYNSRKGRELEANPRAALLFYWDPLGRQVRIEGHTERTSAAESAAYARSRPRGSQLSALASPQSEVVASRRELEDRVADLAELYGDGEVPVPGAWGGFRLSPDSFEFWQHREDRLHDRLVYTAGRAGDGVRWRVHRLGP